MAFAPEIPSSLVPGLTAADRRVLVGLGVVNGPPVGAAGLPTGFVRFLSLVFVTAVGATITYRVWYLHRASGLWCVDTRPDPSTGGIVPVVGADGPQLNGAEIIGWERVYIEALTFTPGATLDAWIEAVTF